MLCNILVPSLCPSHRPTLYVPQARPFVQSVKAESRHVAEVLSELPAEVDVERALDRALSPANAQQGEAAVAQKGLNTDKKILSLKAPPSGDPSASRAKEGKEDGGMAAAVNDKFKSVRVLATKVGNKLYTKAGGGESEKKNKSDAKGP